MRKIDTKDILGIKFGNLTPISESSPYISPSGRKCRMFKCVCDCGNEKTVRYDDIKSGRTTSCGCVARKLTSMRFKSHGLSRTHLYDVWRSMVNRCTNRKAKNYSYYGGRGIYVCDEWIDGPEKFCEWAIENGYSNDLQIDRIDNSKGYSPENCRFTTASINTRNTRGCGYSKYRGVSFDKTNGVFLAGLYVYGRNMNIGRFKTELLALYAVNYSTAKYFPANPELLQLPNGMKYSHAKFNMLGGLTNATNTRRTITRPNQ